MREIKFRAWLINENKMITPYAWQLDNTSLHVCLADWKGPFEIMQYTGFKDRKGKEIYEGDILHQDH